MPATRFRSSARLGDYRGPDQVLGRAIGPRGLTWGVGNVARLSLTMLSVPQVPPRRL